MSDDFDRFRSMVERHLRRMPGSGSALAVIEDWGKEFVEYFVSICLRSLLGYDTDTSAT